MNEKLQEYLLKLLEKMESGVEKGAAFLEGEIPEVIEQVLVWYATYGLIKCLTGFGLLFGAWKLFRYIQTSIPRWYEENRYGDWWVLYIAPAVVAVISLFFINVQWLKIWIAPKLWLLEYASKLVS